MFTLSKLTHYYMWLGLIMLIAIALRIWRLGDIETLVFDEVYFPKFGHNYLVNKPFFDTHPPLSKYLLAAGIWLHNHMPGINDPAFDKAQLKDFSIISIRWLNALTGIVLCFLVARVSLLLHPSRLLSLLTALFIAIDGTFVVESRYGLNNIYLVFFGVLALYCLLKALYTCRWRAWLIACGINLGLCYSVKWNGLGFSLVAWLILFTPLLIIYIKPNLKNKLQQPLTGLHTLKPFEALCYLTLLPFTVYILVWQPHLLQNTRYALIELHQVIINYHTGISKPSTHHYCSKWYEWPLQLRPMAYYFDITQHQPTRIFKDVHLLGNPILFWASATFIPIIIMQWSHNLWRWLQGQAMPTQLPLLSFISLGFCANWLPWVLVSRCTFQYLYMPASLFAFMGCAYVLVQLFHSPKKYIKALAGVLLATIIAATIYWLPTSHGIELTEPQFHQRMWLKSWI